MSAKRLFDVYAIITSYLQPTQLVRFFSERKIPFDTHFVYNGYGGNKGMSVKALKYIFSHFSNINVVGIEAHYLYTSNTKEMSVSKLISKSGLDSRIKYLKVYNGPFGFGLTNEHIFKLDFYQLEALTIEVTSKIDLSALSMCSNLKRLYLCRCYKLHSIPNLPSLRVLSIGNGTSINTTLNMLRTLNVSGYFTIDPICHHIAHIKILNLHAIMHVGIGALTCLANLRILKIQSCEKIINFVHLASFKKLKYLKISCYSGEIKPFVSNSLRKVVLSKCQIIEGPSFLESVHHIEIHDCYKLASFCVPGGRGNLKLINCKNVRSIEWNGKYKIENCPQLLKPNFLTKLRSFMA